MALLGIDTRQPNQMLFPARRRGWCPGWSPWVVSKSTAPGEGRGRGAASAVPQPPGSQRHNGGDGVYSSTHPPVRLTQAQDESFFSTNNSPCLRLLVEIENLIGSIFVPENFHHHH
jgi:hypothetical protein